MTISTKETATSPQATEPRRVVFETRGMAVGFGDRPDVLADVDLKVHAGEFVALLGPSGCGKSTILNLAAGLLRSRRGEVLFDGRPITGVNTSVGYMTQDDTLLPWRTVAANVALPLRMRKVPKQRIQQEVSRYLAFLDLQHAAGLYPAQLSGGMRRRALLARSMIYDPELLLMDEPFAALDAQMRQQLHADLRRAVHSTQQTVLFVTHDLTEAAVLADRVLVIGGGPPGGVVAEFTIPFGAERDPATLPYEDGFARIQQELQEALTRARVPKQKEEE